MSMVNFTHDYDKRDDFDFNFPYLRSNIPESSAYGVVVVDLYSLFHYIWHSIKCTVYW